MLQAKFQDHKTSVSGEDFEGFHHILDFLKKRSLFWSENFKTFV